MKITQFTKKVIPEFQQQFKDVHGFTNKKIFHILDIIHINAKTLLSTNSSSRPYRESINFLFFQNKLDNDQLKECFDFLVNAYTKEVNKLKTPQNTVPNTIAHAHDKYADLPPLVEIDRTQRGSQAKKKLNKESVSKKAKEASVEPVSGRQTYCLTRQRGLRYSSVSKTDDVIFVRSKSSPFRATENLPHTSTTTKDKSSARERLRRFHAQFK